MKTKTGLIISLTALCMFVFSSTTWADGRKNHGHKNHKSKHHKISKHRDSHNHQDHWQKTRHVRKDVHHYYHPVPHRVRHDHHGYRGHDYRHKPYYRHHYRHRPYYRHHYRHRPKHIHHHYYHKPHIKPRHHSHHRTVYRKTDGNTSVLAGASNLGWWIKVISRD